MIPSRLLYTTLALLANAWPAQAHDWLDVATIGAAIENRVHGYRTENVTVTLADGSSCTLPVTFHPDPESIAPVVLLHGITDSRNAYYKYMNRLSKEKQPYKQFLAIDWPRNGDSDCDQVRNPRDAAEAVHRVLEQFLQEKGRPSPSRIVGASMGVVLSIYLAPDYPNARLTWITPPILREPEMKQLVAAVIEAKDLEAARSWIAKVRTDQRPLPLGRLSYGDTLERLQRGAPIMTGTNVEEICHVAGTFAADRVEEIFTGQLDKLTPAYAIHPCLDRFSNRKVVKACAHNIARDCPQSLPAFQ